VRPRDDKCRTVESHVNIAWLAIGSTTLIALAALVGWVQGRRMPAEQGYVSERWLSEQRLAQTQEVDR
jgi:hypothetical protein